MSEDKAKIKGDDNHDNENFKNESEQTACQSDLSNGYHDDNGYHPLSSPTKRSSNVSDEEIKEAYFKIRDAGIRPTAKLIRASIGRGSYTKLQTKISQYDKMLTKSSVDKILNSRVPDTIIQQLSEELAKSAIKHTIEGDDLKIKKLTEQLLTLLDEKAASEAEMTALLDTAETKISELEIQLSEKDKKNRELTLQNQGLLNQVGVLSTELTNIKSKYQLLDELNNLLKLISKDPNLLKVIEEKMEEK